MKTRIQDMTSGSPGRLIILFAIPLMLGNICQQLYTMVDTMIVGQVAGVEALAALGSVDFLMWIVTGISTGITQGFSILISQHYGAGNGVALRKVIAHSYRLTAITAVLVFALSQLLASAALTGLHTPQNIIGMALLYLRIIFCGIPFTTAYNMFACELRAIGNSKAPLTAMLIASLINIVLDLLFVAVFGWGIAGAAIATIIAQLFSAIYCFAILKQIKLVQLAKSDFEHEAKLDLNLLQLGIPVVFQNIIIGVGGLVVQYVINGYGFLFVAGFTAKELLTALAVSLVKFQEGKPFFVNCYPRVVTQDGSREAQLLVDEMMEACDCEWRGLGVIPKSGMKLRQEWQEFDARLKYQMPKIEGKPNPACRCGDVLQGKCKPSDCKVFGKGCTPQHPIGACMVSGEGACSAYYQYS